MASTEQPQLAEPGPVLYLVGQPLAAAQYHLDMASLAAHNPLMVFDPGQPSAFYDWLRSAKKPSNNRPHSSTWQKILSQHSTSKPKEHGGAPNPAGVQNHVHVTSFQMTEPAGQQGFRATISFPNAFRPDDGIPVEGVGTGLNSEMAKEGAALQVVAQLLATNPPEVRLLDKDWISGDVELVRQQAGWHAKFAGPQRAEGPMSGQSLAPRCSGYQAPPQGGEAKREMDKKKLLDQIIQYHHSLQRPEDPNPCKLKQGKRSWAPALDRLWKPGTLKQWIEASGEFTVVPQVGSNQWTFKFAIRPLAPEAPAIGGIAPPVAPKPFRPCPKPPPRPVPSPPRAKPKPGPPPGPPPACQTTQSQAGDWSLRPWGHGASTQIGDGKGKGKGKGWDDGNFRPKGTRGWSACQADASNWISPACLLHYGASSPPSPPQPTMDQSIHAWDSSHRPRGEDHSWWASNREWQCGWSSQWRDPDQHS